MGRVLEGEGGDEGGEEIKCWMVLGWFDWDVDSTFGGSV